MCKMKEKIIKNPEPGYADLSDTELVYEISKKNKLAFEEFFKRYAKKVKFLMLRMGAKELDAEEISQEVMVILWRKSALYDSSKSTVPAWLYTIARNYRIDILRKRHSSALDIDDPTFVPEPHLNSVQILIKKQRKESVRTILKKLSPDRKKLLIAVFFEGLTHTELAQKFDKPLGTIKSRLRLIYDSLRKIDELRSSNE